MGLKRFWQNPSHHPAPGTQPSSLYQFLPSHTVNRDFFSSLFFRFGPRLTAHSPDVEDDDNELLLFPLTTFHPAASLIGFLTMHIFTLGLLFVSAHPRSFHNLLISSQSALRRRIRSVFFGMTARDNEIPSTKSYLTSALLQNLLLVAVDYNQLLTVMLNAHLQLSRPKNTLLSCFGVVTYVLCFVTICFLVRPTETHTVV